MTNKSPIGVGRTATVTIWKNGSGGQVVKLFHAGIGEQVAEREFAKAQAAWKAGAPTPQPYGPIIKVDARFGIIFDFVDGVTLLKKIQTYPTRIKHYSQRLAQMHIDLACLRPEGLPRLKEKLANAITNTPLLSALEKSQLGDLLNTLPDGSSLCHGDFHPDNILVSEQQGAAPTIIDWADASIGHSAADVARSLILLDFGWRGSEGPKFRAKWGAKLIRRFYLSHYLTLTTTPVENLTHWMIIVAAARLNENIAPENEALLQFVRKGLAKI